MKGNLPVFKPTKKQIALLKAMLDIEVKPTIHATCRAAGISKDSYYKWFNEPQFVEWFSKEWDLAMTRQVSWLDRVGLRMSVKDYRYWEAMQTKYGKLRKGVDITTDGDKINKPDLTKLTVEELKQLEELANKTRN